MGPNKIRERIHRSEHFVQCIFYWIVGSNENFTLNIFNLYQMSLCVDYISADQGIILSTNNQVLQWMDQSSYNSNSV